MGIKETNICRCKADKQPKGATDTLFAPLKGKMKVLKKIKRRMGLASRSSSHGGGTNNLPPLLFHHVHGENIRISRDGTVAKRVESFCKGIAFSSRPVKVNEKVCIKFLEISNNWSGVIRFGFTSNDPTGLRYDLPKYACPDLTNKPGYWAKALPERFCAQGAVLFYYVTATGDVHFGINGEEKGVFFGNVETRGPLWCLIDVYGNSTAIEFVDVRHQLNNSNRYSTGNCEVFRPDPVERITYPMQQMAIQPNEELSLPLLRYQPPHLNYQAMALHRTRGRNVRFMNGNRSVAYRTDTEFCQGYVFTSRPLQIGERMVVQILGTEPMFQGCLGLGLTSCDPALLTSADLPDDSNCLLDRPEYWVVSRDIARHLHKGDEVSFCVSAEGEVRIGRNGCPPTIVIHVDHTLRLYAFFDIYGSTQRIRVLSCPAPQPTQVVQHGGIGAVSPQRNPERRIISPVTPSSAASESMNSINAQSEQLRRQQQAVSAAQPVVAAQPPAPPQPVMCVAPADIQVQPGANGGAVLSVILPPIIQQTNGHHLNGHMGGPAGYQAGPVTQPGQHVTVGGQAGPGMPTGTMVSVCSSNYVEPLSDSSAYSTPLPWSEAVAALPPSSMSAPGVPPPPGAECTICYEQPIDAVLYMCGHMCMCYECALQQWRGKGGGHCPLCRAVIRDVIRTYKS